MLFPCNYFNNSYRLPVGTPFAGHASWLVSWSLYLLETSIFFVILPEAEKEEHNLSLLRGNTKGSNEIIEDSRRMANMTEKFSKDLARSFLEALLVQRYCYKKKK